jgi:hypothetical protein
MEWQTWRTGQDTGNFVCICEFQFQGGDVVKRNGNVIGQIIKQKGQRFALPLLFYYFLNRSVFKIFAAIFSPCLLPSVQE